MNISLYLQFLVSGLTLGSIYALIALALVTTYNITGILNMAQGEFVTLGALTACTLYAAGFSLPAAFCLAVLITALAGALVERLAINPVRNFSSITLIIITIGLSIMIRGLALLIWGTNPYSLPAFTQGGPLKIMEAAVNLQSIWVFGLLIITVTGLFIFMEKTYWGKAVRACVINRVAAELMGINPYILSLLAFVVSGALGAAAGVFITPITLATYDMGFTLGLKGFVAAIIGGINNVGGAIIGGLLLGVLEIFGAGLISSGLKDAIALIVLIIVLLLRPQGIIGVVTGRKV
ncbi:MAG TPA: branched-chain amino acid ABC transporter permease [Desulfitobacteriaceae bacterium]|jgi:branched-chain amino acid transport system permease protein|nr:branched-chain amino acid ABC transporter permease [Desulfitobacteriaceae bacterium]